MRRLCAIGLAVIAAALGAWGCGSNASVSRPAPETPTDIREATTIEQALAVYGRTTKLIQSQLKSCEDALPPGYPKRSCREDVGALSIQRARQLRGPLRPLRSRLGPRCGPVVKSVLAMPVGAAGPALAKAAKICRREYDRAVGA